MKNLLLLLILPSIALAFDTFESERYMYAYMRFTKEVKRMSSNIPLYQNETGIIQELKFELKSCGISSTENSCLDSKFKSVKALESFDNEKLEGVRFLIKAFSKDMMDQSLIVQVMTIHAEFEAIRVDRVEFFKETIPMTSEGFSAFFSRYLKNEGVKIFETNEFYPNEVANYMNLASNSENSLEIFHAITLARSLDSEKIHSEEINNILKDKFEIILNTKAPLYQIEFLKLFEGDLKKELADKFFQSSDTLAKEQSAIALANLGVSDSKVKDTVISVIKNTLNYHDQLAALEGLAKIKSTLDDEIIILQSIKSGNAEVSKRAFELSSQIKFTKEHLNYLAAELNNPTPEYRVYMLDFLSKIDLPESTKIILGSLTDNAEPVAQKAFKILKDRKLDDGDLKKIKKDLKTFKDFTKFYALQLLDRDKSEEISFIFIDHLKDLFPKIEELCVQLLLGRDITPNIKNTLWKMVKKKKTKIYALKILSKLETPEVTGLLISELGEVEENDLSGLYEVIKKRTLDTKNYDAIKATFRNKNPRVRTFAIKLLAKFPDKPTLDFLKSAITSEPEKLVKNTIEILIKFIEEKLNPTPVVTPTTPTEPPVIPPAPIEPTTNPPGVPPVPPTPAN